MQEHQSFSPSDESRDVRSKEWRQFVVSVLGALGILMVMTFFAACSESQRNSVLSDNEDSHLLFYSRCDAAGPVTIYVDAVEQCTDVTTGDSGCLVSVGKGDRSYYATGTGQNWGSATDPIIIHVGYR